jgi:hypothetical protein
MAGASAVAMCVRRRGRVGLQWAGVCGGGGEWVCSGHVRAAGMRISPQGEICMGALILATYYWSMYTTYLKRSQYGMNLS